MVERIARFWLESRNPHLKQPTRKGAESEGHMDGEPAPQETPSRTRGLMPPWQPGQSGNPAGRQRGSRNKLSDDFFKALADDFAEHGVQSIIAMRTERPADYAKMIAALQSKEFTGEDGEALGLVIFKGLNDTDG